VAYRRLIQKSVPLKNATEFQASTAFDIIKVSRRVFEVGEAHLQALIASLGEAWGGFAAASGAGDNKFRLRFSETELEQIESDAEAADAGIQAMSEIKRRLGRFWPEKGAVPIRYYDETKNLLRQLKEELLCELALDETDRKVFEEFWAARRTANRTAKKRGMRDNLSLLHWL